MHHALILCYVGIRIRMWISVHANVASSKTLVECNLGDSWYMQGWVQHNAEGTITGSLVCHGEDARHQHQHTNVNDKSM